MINDERKTKIPNSETLEAFSEIEMLKNSPSLTTKIYNSFSELLQEVDSELQE